MSKEADKSIEVNTRPAKMTAKSVVITRTSGQPVRSSFVGNSRMSASFGAKINPSILSNMASGNVEQFRSSRDKEKRDMQNCNEHLASYIEKMRLNDTKNKRLEGELEAMRKQAQKDWKPIHDMYNNELEQARKIIADLSTEKGLEDAKIIGLQDELSSLKILVAQLESNSRDYVCKINDYANNIGEQEGELTALRLRIGSFDDEQKRYLDTIQRLRDECARLRNDLNAETTAHIEQEVYAQTKAEEAEFYHDLLDKVQTYKDEPVKIKGLDVDQFYKDELRKTVTDLQQNYDALFNQTTIDLEAKFCNQMDQMRAGNTRDSLELEHSKSENKRVSDSLNNLKSQLAELERNLATMKCERDNYMMQFGDKEMELDREAAENARAQREMQDNIEILITQLNDLTNSKRNMEVEIACYAKLLEGEENRTGLRQLIAQTIGTRTGGGNLLADVIGQSTLDSTSTAKTTIQRTSKGVVGFHSVDSNGGSATIENTTSGQRQKSQNLSGWRIQKFVNGNMACEALLPSKELKPSKTFTVFAKGANAKITNPDAESICELHSWGIGPGQYVLYDDVMQTRSSVHVMVEHLPACFTVFSECCYWDGQSSPFYDMEKYGADVKQGKGNPNYKADVIIGKWELLPVESLF